MDLFKGGKLGEGGKSEPDGSAGASIRGYGVPGRTEPAGEVKANEFEVDEERMDGDNVGVCDAGMGDVEAREWGYCWFWKGRAGREEALDKGSSRWEGSGQSENVGEALGAVVGIWAGEALNVDGVEGRGVGAEGAEPDDTG